MDKVNSYWYNIILLQVTGTSYHIINAGEFGIVYKGYLTGQYINETVAIKTLKGTLSRYIMYHFSLMVAIHCIKIGFIDNEAVQELLRECVKMKSLNHLHVMTLKGICLDGGPVPYIILPYMANGSLLSYLKKERRNLIVSVEEEDNDEEERQSQVSLLIR